MARRRGAVVATLIGAALVGIAGRSFRRLAIAEHSMEPALSSGDFVVARTARWPQRGDIVTFRHPFREEMLLVKRVVGLPGERLTIANGQVHIDGEVLAEGWADGPTRPDAIFCANDLMAVGCYEALKELGEQVGKTVAVMGYDDQEIAQHLSPALSTVLLPHPEGPTKAVTRPPGNTWSNSRNRSIRPTW